MSSSLLIQRSFTSALKQPGELLSSFIHHTRRTALSEYNVNNIEEEKIDYDEEATAATALESEVDVQSDGERVVQNDQEAAENCASKHQIIENASPKGQQVEQAEENLDDQEEEAGVPEFSAEFDIIKRLGVGMIGRVYLVRHRAKDEYMALKIMPKRKVIEMQQVEHVLNERNILASGIDHPFIVSMFSTSSDADFLYILMEYLPGGDLFHHIRAKKRFTEDTARFYAMQVVSAIGYLHDRSIVYRDLKPENIMLDQSGFIKLVDFGFSKKVAHSTWTLCGTPKYLAPEIILSKAYTKAVDWWTVGILIYEMLVGHPPFNDSDPMVVYASIVGGKIEWPPDPFAELATAKDLTQRFLIRDHRKRLGSNRNGFYEVKRHAWFQVLKWDLMEKKQYKPPFGPFPAIEENNDSDVAKTFSKWRNTILGSQAQGNPSASPCISPDSPDPFKDF